MKIHDPMCLWMDSQCDDMCKYNHSGYCEHFFCQCDLIAKVREDMLQRVVDLSYYIDSSDPFEQGYTIGREIAIEVLSKAVVAS
jgi:hypothetical protein